MDQMIKKQLQIIACKVRIGVIESTYNAKSGHPGGSLSISDLLTYLYFAKMNINVKNLKCMKGIDWYSQRDIVLPHFILY